MVACLEVQLPSTRKAEFGNILVKDFTDDCVCMSELLSTTDKLIYFIVTSSLGDFVVPLIHNHRCIEKIYVYDESENQESSDWTRSYRKIGDVKCSIDELAQQIKQDMDSIMQRPSHWSRSKSLFAELCLQKEQINIPVPTSDLSINDLSTFRIVSLSLDQDRPFTMSHSEIKIDHFSNLDQCVNSMKRDKLTAIFLIIWMDQFRAIQSVVELDVVHAVYIVIGREFRQPIETISEYSKLSGIFFPSEGLLEQLTTDICFYRQIRIRTPVLSVFKIEPRILKDPTSQQSDFLFFQLFSDILPQLPTKPVSTLTMDTTDTNQQLSRLIEANVTISQLFKQFDASKLQDSVAKLKEINDYIMSLPKDLDNPPDTVYQAQSAFLGNEKMIADTVYWAQLVSQDDLDTMKENADAFLAIHTFVLASRSFEYVAKICRRAVDNQLNVVLFELKLSDQASVAALDSETVIFRLGSLFRLVSTDSAPDGVWRVQLEPADGSMRRIKDQLRVEIGGHLTWLTFGNYLTAFKRSNEAKNYYTYLLLVLPQDHPALASINSNKDLIYSEVNRDDTALDPFQKAEDSSNVHLSNWNERQNVPLTDLPPLQSPTIDKVAVLDKSAEINYREGKLSEALENYRQALKIANDPQSQQMLQAKIETLLSSNRDSEN